MPSSAGDGRCPELVFAGSSNFLNHDGFFIGNSTQLVNGYLMQAPPQELLGDSRGSTRCISIAKNRAVVHDSDVRLAPVLLDIEKRICIYSYNKHSYLECLWTVMQKEYKSYKGSRRKFVL